MSNLQETHEHETYMRLALAEAKKAYAAGDTPVGAVIVLEGKIVGTGYNKVESLGDPTAHAEILAIREATEALGKKWLLDATLYTTTEPCLMCAGAAVLARLSKIVAGCESDKNGSCGTVRDVLLDSALNHKVAYESGILAKECAELMSKFFKELREKKA